MKPEPTPVAGTPPNGSVVSPPLPVVILTTAGPSLAATSITADDSSIVTGCVPPVVVALPIEAGGTGWSKAPLRSSTSTVPPDATTADRSDAAITVPRPGPWRRGLTGAAGVAAYGAAASGATGA